jgi:double-strand break repair protein MRE11
MDILSDQELNFPSSIHHSANFLEPNLNVSIPIFTIHGNHDDNVGNLSSMDLLSTAGLVNYFGKVNDLSHIHLSPIIMQKGDTKIGLYGFSHVPDRRCYALFKDSKVSIDFPDFDNIFNILVLHQNRADRGAKNFLRAELLPQQMNLVIWGHEHDCKIDPEPYDKINICQPGSSVATSLCDGEAKEKHIGILEVKFDKYRNENVFKLVKVELNTVRPFIFKKIDLQDYVDEIQAIKIKEPRLKIENFLDSMVEKMIEESKGKHTKHSRQPKLPLIRLRVNFNDEEQLINVKRFGHKYENRVANNSEILLFKRNIKRSKTEKIEADHDVLDSAVGQRTHQDRVEDIVEKYFNEVDDEKYKLKLLNLKCLTEAVKQLVYKDDENGASELINSQHVEAFKLLSERNIEENEIDYVLSRFHHELSAEAFEKALNSLQNEVRDVANPDNRLTFDGSDSDADDNMDGTRKATAKPARGRGSRGARGNTTRGRGKASTTLNDSANTSKTTRGGRGSKVMQQTLAQQLSSRQSQRKATQQQVSFIQDSDSD